MAEPVLRRYWVKLRNGIAFPQFDSTGTEHSWQEYQIPPDKVLFLPFSKDLARKIKAKTEVIDLPPLEFEVRHDIDWCRKSFLTYIPHAICGFCGAELPEGAVAECPRCFASNRWYCDYCDSLISNPIIDTKTQTVLCPVHHGRGLMQINQIGEMWEEKIRHYTIIVVDGVRHIILDPVKK